MSAPRVLIVEDHALITDSLVLALGSQAGFEARAVPPDALEHDDVVAAAAAFGPQVVLLDLSLGVGAGGLPRKGTPLIGPLRELGACVLVLSASTDRIRLAECLEAGAAGLLNKAQPFHEVIEAIQDVLDGRPRLRAGERDDLLAELRRWRAEREQRFGPFQRLTERERHVLEAVIDGLPADEIAVRDGVSITTVRTHIRAALDKLGVKSQLAAVALARRTGWPADH
jgi:DNA-binding NarL/FixJ family response regulator